MVPLLLQDYLVGEVKNILKEIKLKDAKGDEVAINAYPQALPAKKGIKDSEHFPYVLVVLTDGSDTDEDTTCTCQVMFLAGIYDNEDSYQGYRDSVNIINKIYEHLASKRVFDNKYTVAFPFEWKLPEEDTYPFYFSALMTKWEVPKAIQNNNSYI